MKYQVLERDKAKYIGLVLLNEMIQFQTYFPTKCIGENTFISTYLEQMKVDGLIEVSGDKYIPTLKGRETLQGLYNLYYEYLKMFDIYCAVDLKSGEFAFSRMSEDMTTEDWHNFLNEDRFSDVRVAVAEFKGVSPIKFVFLSFLNENRFDTIGDRWQYNLTGDSIWLEIEEICNTAITLDYLKADDVIVNIISEGSKIAIDLIKMDTKIAVDDVDVIEEVEEYVEVVEMPNYGYSYWEVYYDPYYISPIWLLF